MQKRTFKYLEKGKAIPCPAGERMKDKHTLVRDGNNLTLKKVGQIDIVEQIQSYEDGVSLAKMIERFKRGDTSALQRGQVFYGDVSGYETDPAQVINQTREVVTEIGKKKAEAVEDPKPDQLPKEENVSENGKEGEVNA